MKRSVQQNLFAPEPDRPEWEIAAEQDQLLAEVALVLPMEQVFHYVVPEPYRDRIEPGQRVVVPFGRSNRQVTAFCVGLTRDNSGKRQLKELISLVDEKPLVNRQLLELTRWMADRYLCSWGQALETAVPAGVKNRSGTREINFFSLPPRHRLTAC